MKYLLFFLSLIALQARAQKSDLIVTATGDSLFGKVRITGSSIYIQNAGGIEQSVEPSTVQVVRYANNKEKLVHRGRLYTYSDNLWDLEKNFYPKGAIDTVLLLTSIYETPKMSLYEAKDKMNSTYYFYKMPTDPAPVQLVVHYYLSESNSSSVRGFRMSGDPQSQVIMVTERGFANQLRTIMQGCTRIDPTAWDVLDYRVYSLKYVIRQFNKCD
jgi:hypothetical protein